MEWANGGDKRVGICYKRARGRHRWIGGQSAAAAADHRRPTDRTLPATTLTRASDKPMTTSDILAVLRDYKVEVAERYGLQTIGVFGSVARGENGSRSDVDIVVRISQPDLFVLAGIKSDLEERLHLPVDVVTDSENMNRLLKRRIEREAVYA